MCLFYLGNVYVIRLVILATQNLTAIFNCHCKDCRKATGSVFGTNLFFSENNVKSMVNFLFSSIFLIVGVLSQNSFVLAVDP